MIRVKFIATSGNSPEEFIDECYVDEDKDLETEIKKAVEEFNKEEKGKYGSKVRLRKFVRLIDSPRQKQHDWDKASLFGKKDCSGLSYDLWRCKCCGLEKKVISLDSVPRAGDCYPERACAICQKVFKTEKNLTKHKDTILHYKNEQKRMNE